MDLFINTSIALSVFLFFICLIIYREIISKRKQNKNKKNEIVHTAVMTTRRRRGSPRRYK